MVLFPFAILIFEAVPRLLTSHADDINTGFYFPWCLVQREQTMTFIMIRL